MLDTLKQRHFLSSTQDNRKFDCLFCVFLVCLNSKRQFVFTILKRLISEPPETDLRPLTHRVFHSHHTIIPGVCQLEER